MKTSLVQTLSAVRRRGLLGPAVLAVLALTAGSGVGVLIRSVRAGSPFQTAPCSIGEFKEFTRLQIQEERFWSTLREQHKIPQNCAIVLDGEEWVWAPLPQDEIIRLRHSPTSATTAPVGSASK